MDAEQAREGYRTAVQLIGYEGKMIWDSFRSLLAADTVLVSLAGAVPKVYPKLVGLPALLAIVGLVVTAAWALITARNFDSYRYWFAWVRKYEAIALGSEDHLLQIGMRFAQGESVTVVNQHRQRWASRLFRVEWLMYVVILAFGVVHGYLLFAST